MEFEDQMIKYEMIDLESKGFVTFSKKRLLAIFSGERFASKSRRRLMDYLPDGWTESDIVVMDHDDTILLLSAEKTKEATRWL